MQHAMSDVDLYVIYDFHNHIYRPKKLIRQSIDDESDTTKIYIEKFKEQVYKGVPQAHEVLFSRPEQWLDHHEDWPGIAESIKENFDIFLPDILETYKRTALNFMLTDDFKKNRHALRIILNAQDLKNRGEFNPRLSEDVINEITRVAKLPFTFRQEYFKDLLFEL